MGRAKAALLDSLGAPEKVALDIDFASIICTAPIIMAQPPGLYEKYGLNAKIIKTARRAVARDTSFNGEYGASHVPTRMPQGLSLGAGPTAEPCSMPAGSEYQRPSHRAGQPTLRQARSQAVEGL
jgi:nitrate/nitrite transport system substrate-binding protein